ncbi:MAG TPA: VWA domain-containing protein [Candidatus Binatia bacterium]|nr:VWA domain-containing protein [Candidatus Binatia bacterium]
MTTKNGTRRAGKPKMWVVLFSILGAALTFSEVSWAQSASQAGQEQSQQPAQTQQGIPDAPSTVQPPTEAPEPAVPAKPEEKKPVERDPWTNQPINKIPPNPVPAADDSTPPPPMPPVKTLPPGSVKKPNPKSEEQLYTLVVHTNFVQVPVTVKYHDGRMVDGLEPSDFTVMENGVKQKLTFFSSDPFALSVAIVLDLGMSDDAVQRVNQTFSALVGSFAPYDEVALYTYSSTVSEVQDFAAANQKMLALLNQMRNIRGENNGPAVLSGPLAPNGPIVNGMPVGSPTEPVYTPPKESHVLNDAILKAALDLSKRPRTRRKMILVISDGREYGSKAGYKDVLRLLLSNEIQVKAVAVEDAAIPVYRRIERFHLPHEEIGDILPKYTSATGGGTPYSELTRSAIEDIYAQAMSESRNQYTLGYTPAKPKVPTAAYRNIEVLVDRPGLKIYAKDGYYAAPAAR